MTSAIIHEQPAKHIATLLLAKRYLSSQNPHRNPSRLIGALSELFS